METLIARLLKAFEDGKLTRRQLIQSLALAAAAAPAAASGQSAQSTPPAAPRAAAGGKAPWKTVRLDHISYAVADYKKSVAFYTDLMGWEVKNDAGNQATLNINNIGEIIIRNSRRPAESGANGPAASGRGDRPPLTGVINHISWGIDPWNTEAVEAELKRRGLTPRPDMVGDDFKSFHVLDPDGWDLQISNQTK
jgi:catechol 2,3-dioxygenase-like lactoylglutathione lyase family enzyme